MNNSVYRAGVARADITPPVGIRLIGYAVREGFSHSVDEPLTVTALAIGGVDSAGGNSTVIFLAVDVAWLSVRFADEVRALCAEASGVPSSHIVINANHTHSSPATPDYFTYGPDDQLAMERDYAQLFRDRCQYVSREAVAAMQPARIGMGWSECRGNINRRQKMPDGGVLLGEDPDGACDRSVGVLRVDDLQGNPIAVAFRYSCHTVTLGPKTNVISPDFIAPARRIIEGALGCPSLFLQGCAGNLNPVSGIGQDADSEPNFKDERNRLGHQLGGAVLQAAESVRTHRQRAVPRLVQSIAVYWLYEYESLPPGETGFVNVAQSTMQLALTKFPSLDDVRQERAEWASKLSDAEQSGASEWRLGPLVRFNKWADIRLQTAEDGPNPALVSFPIQVIRIGDFKIATLPFEPMAETGFALRDVLGQDTFILGYCNGQVSYLPTPEVSAEGGMEAKLAYKMLMVPAEVPGSWEPQVKAEVIDLAARLSG